MGLRYIVSEAQNKNEEVTVREQKVRMDMESQTRMP